jgi:hypothetical protein
VSLTQCLSCNTNIIWRISAFVSSLKFAIDHLGRTLLVSTKNINQAPSTSLTCLSEQDAFTRIFFKKDQDRTKIREVEKRKGLGGGFAARVLGYGKPHRAFLPVD